MRNAFGYLKHCFDHFIIEDSSWPLPEPIRTSMPSPILFLSIKVFLQARKYGMHLTMPNLWFATLVWMLQCVLTCSTQKWPQKGISRHLSSGKRFLLKNAVLSKRWLVPDRYIPLEFFITVLKLDLGWSTSWSGSSRRETQRVDGVAEGSSAGLLGIHRELNVPLAFKIFDFGCQKNFNEENVSY